MRCQKCGYISFDHLDTCRKCHKPMADPGFKGTTCSVAVPVFLQLSEEMAVVEMEEDIVEVLDPDLDLLTAEVDEEISFEPEIIEDQGIAFQEVLPVDTGKEDDHEIAFDDFDLAFDSEAKDSDLTVDDDLMLDTSRFEDVPVHNQTEVQPLNLQIPDDLADISDLARPDLEDIVLADAAMATDNDLDIDLDFGDLDLAAFDSPVAERKETVTAAGTAQNDLADLSLDDLDLSADLPEISPPASAPPVADDLDLDFDLDFDLDLGTLDAKQESKKKAS